MRCVVHHLSKEVVSGPFAHGLTASRTIRQIIFPRKDNNKVLFAIFLTLNYHITTSLPVKKYKIIEHPKSYSVQSNLAKCTWNLARISMHLSKVGNYAEFELYFVVPALLADLQFGLGLSDLCCFCENMTELSQDLRQLLSPRQLGMKTERAKRDRRAKTAYKAGKRANGILLYLQIDLNVKKCPFTLSLSDLCCFRENMTELSPDLRQLPCE
ncbi:hypothetical protein T11_8719 [Trichinella zimbabwensis]|uniref:Uncharacterized protein n=1 Tax=Trichinella zimbabwensis TaxID=268475 RepID=A0A0V1HS17_9BILA|nr:hypothetical protein T11_8719 [Trichinella zimbabwensis]